VCGRTRQGRRTVPCSRFPIPVVEVAGFSAREHSSILGTSQATPDGILGKVSHHRRLTHGWVKGVFGFSMRRRGCEKVETFLIDLGGWVWCNGAVLAMFKFIRR
jgi:hypothetical protein